MNTENCTNCGVPMNLHGTACGWSNATRAVPWMDNYAGGSGKFVIATESEHDRLKAQKEDMEQNAIANVRHLWPDDECPTTEMVCRRLLEMDSELTCLRSDIPNASALLLDQEKSLRRSETAALQSDLDHWVFERDKMQARAQMAEKERDALITQIQEAKAPISTTPTNSDQPTGSCLICGHLRLFMVWNSTCPDAGVCGDCKAGAQRYEETRRDLENAQQWIDSDPEWKAAFLKTHEILKKQKDEAERRLGIIVAAEKEYLHTLGELRAELEKVAKERKM